MIRLLLLSLCLTAPFISKAEDTTIYKCIIKDIPTFSQTPCAKDAEIITLKTINVTKAYSSKLQSNKAPDTSVDSYLKIQQIDRDIKRLQLSIKEHQKEYAEKKQQINYMTQDKANRLGASSIADAIAMKTASLKQSYEPAIKQAQQQIESLTQQKLQLKQP